MYPDTIEDGKEMTGKEKVLMEDGYSIQRKIRKKRQQ